MSTYFTIAMLVLLVDLLACTAFKYNFHFVLSFMLSLIWPLTLPFLIWGVIITARGRQPSSRDRP